jgi:hypothetical protein
MICQKALRTPPLYPFLKKEGTDRFYDDAQLSLRYLKKSRAIPLLTISLVCTLT